MHRDRPPPTTRESEGRRLAMSSFSATLSCLRQYVNQNTGAIHDLRMVITPYQPSTAPTMNLMPGLDVSDDDDRNVTKPLDLFPQQVGFGSPIAPSVEHEVEEPAAKQQLTMVYGGKVVVFDDFSDEEAKDLILYVKSCCGTSPGTASPSSSTSAVVADRPPMVRRRTNHGFLKKRMERMHSKVPYQVDDSPSPKAPLVVMKKQEVSQPWLALGQQASSHTP